MIPLISVIIPVYNVSSYLPKCIDSVTGQTYRNLDIILVDDGSTDDCPGICDAYAWKDSRIRVIHKKNGGLSDARNKGIDIARGEYITFIDSDDYVALDMVEYLYRLLLEHNADMSVCQWNEVYEGTGNVQPGRQTADRVVVGNRECMKDFFTRYGIETVAWGKLYKRSMFRDVRYPYGKFHEDVYTTYLLVAQCDRIAVGKERKYNYLQRESSQSKIAFQMKELSVVEAAEERRQFIAKHYPECGKYANASVVYGSNVCVLKMIQAGQFLPKELNRIQTNYRDYEWDFLQGRSSAKAKIFSILAWCNLHLLVKCLIPFLKR